MAATYRNPSHSRVQNSSDDGEINDSSNSDSDATDALWSKKRTKPEYSERTQPTVSLMKPKRSRNVNIWGSVLTQQSSDDISSSLGAVGMRNKICRGPESFDLPSNFNVEQTARPAESSESSDDEPQGKTEQPKKSEGSKRKRKRKKSKKTNNVPTFKPGQEVNLNRRADLSDTDPVDKVAEEIAFRLWERKKDLIRAITEVVGVTTAIDFCNKTEQIEKSGGLMTLNGLRRRTPGGTFLHLIRNDSRLDQEPINRVFALEAERDKMLWELRKQSKKRPQEQKNINCEMDDLSTLPESKSRLAKDTENQPSDPAASSPAPSIQISSTPSVEKKNGGELSEGELMDSDEEVETFG